MVILIESAESAQLYRDAYDEAQRIIRVNDEVRIQWSECPALPAVHRRAADAADGEPATSGKLASSKIAQKRGWTKRA